MPVYVYEKECLKCGHKEIVSVSPNCMMGDDVWEEWSKKVSSTTHVCPICGELMA